MPTIVGLCMAFALLALFSYFKYPKTSLNLHFKNRIKFPIHKSQDLAQEWADVVDDLASAIRAGLSLPQAMVLLSKSGPEKIRPSFESAMTRYQVTGDFAGSLNILSDLAKDPVADKFVSALQIAYEVGGTDLGNLLRTLSEVIREESKLRGEINARQSWTVNGAKLAIAAPWLTVLILGTRESALEIYLASQGLRLLSACFIFSVLAYFLMLKIGQLPKAKRIHA
ncbi:MAG: hypothetical protein RL355_737 [Actinomycetota bacterium]|jgi:tight adherence protein B